MSQDFQVGDPVLLARLKAKVDLAGNGCWVWKGHVGKRGYGLMRLGSSRLRAPQVYAHRLSWALHFGHIEPRQHVLHVCDTPRCVNPDHLFLGDQQLNVADMVLKDRQARGERNGHAKLTDAQAAEIRRRRRAGERGKDLAEEFGVSQPTICQVANGKQFKHLVDIV